MSESCASGFPLTFHVSKLPDQNERIRKAIAQNKGGECEKGKKEVTVRRKKKKKERRKKKERKKAGGPFLLWVATFPVVAVSRVCLCVCREGLQGGE